MQVVKTAQDVRGLRWADPTLTWGLVPTMGALHEGHLSLVRRARAENDRVGVSIFVNPIQFNRQDDLDAYPRDLERDAELLAAEGVDLIWTPSNTEMYPPDFQTYVSVETMTAGLEGAARPGHFRGVTTVVAKLFNVFQPTRAYFGQKDAQQAAVIRQMVRDLAFNLDIIVCPIVREPDGLAMSSRNVRLGPEARQAALVLFRALNAARSAWENGCRDGDRLRDTMRAVIAAEPLARLDYVSAAHPVTLQEIEGETEQVLLSMAVFIGDVRLIDNMVLKTGAVE
ncbi:MAG: pantoate--beta-alanine ligase [Anaerolineae bacterium]|nr:pantoate--beta-alanine ligase [Anaerolineae bacterium]